MNRVDAVLEAGSYFVYADGIGNEHINDILLTAEWAPASGGTRGDSRGGTRGDSCSTPGYLTEVSDNSGGFVYF